MPRKGENIFKRKDGRWEGRYIKGYDISGKIKYGFCYGKTYKEAKDKVVKAKATLLSNKLPAVNNNHRRFFSFCNEWLCLQRDKVKESTYVKYNTTMSLHILPKLGECLPLGITSQTVEAFKKELLDEGLSAKTVKDVLVILRSILKYMEGEFPGTFPAIKIHYPKEQKKEVRVLNPEEQRILIGYLKENIDDCKRGILLAMMTGLRIGEICALRWGNFSLRDKTLRINATMQRIKNIDNNTECKTKICIGTPKSDNSTRIIPVPDSVIRLYQNRAVEHSPNNFVLTGTQDFMEPRNLSRRLEKYTKECGLEGVHFHTLRHTFATRCVEVGFEIKSLSEILGHANTSITIERYIHSSMKLKRSNMEKLDAFEF